MFRALAADLLVYETLGARDKDCPAGSQKERQRECRSSAYVRLRNRFASRTGRIRWHVPDWLSVETLFSGRWSLALVVGLRGHWSLASVLFLYEYGAAYFNAPERCHRRSSHVAGLTAENMRIFHGRKGCRSQPAGRRLSASRPVSQSSSRPCWHVHATRRSFRDLVACCRSRLL